MYKLALNMVLGYRTYYLNYLIKKQLNQNFGFNFNCSIDYYKQMINCINYKSLIHLCAPRVV